MIKRPLKDGSWPLVLSYGFAGLLVHAFFWRVSEPRALFSDFYKAYFPAAEQLWESGAQATWPLTETGVGGFVNMPIVAYLFVPLLPFGEHYAGWVFYAVGVAAMLAIWALLIRSKWMAMREGAVWLFLILANGPMVNSLREGNTTHLVFCLLVVTLLLWHARHEYSVGLLIGFCALIKPPLLLYGLYFAARQRWRIVAGGVSMIGLVAILSVVVFGLDANIRWYEDSVQPYLGRVVPALNVQSLDGFLIRLQLGERHLFDWTPHEPALMHRLARYLVLAGLFALLIRIIFFDRASTAEQKGSTSRRDRLEFTVVLNVAIVTSPLSWTHYYLFLLLPWGLYLSGRLGLPDDRATRWLMGASMALASLPLVILPMQPGWLPAIFARTAISAWLFGGLLCLAALLRGAFYPSDERLPLSRKAVAVS